jgi:hypothetical protein
MYMQHRSKDVKYNTRDRDEEGYHAATATVISASTALVSFQFTPCISTTCYVVSDQLVSSCGYWEFDLSLVYMRSGATSQYNLWWCSVNGLLLVLLDFVLLEWNDYSVVAAKQTYVFDSLNDFIFLASCLFNYIHLYI